MRACQGDESAPDNSFDWTTLGALLPHEEELVLRWDPLKEENDGEKQREEDEKKQAMGNPTLYMALHP